MKKKVSGFILAGFLLCTLPVTLQGQSYQKLWKEVEAAEINDLPQTVIKYAEQIYRKAEKEKNSGQMFKAYMVRSKYRQSIAPDSFYVDLQGLEAWAHTTTKLVDCAVLHTLIANIYGEYASKNRYAMKKRTEMNDIQPPADIREWSGNMFVCKVLDNTRAALDHSDLLFALSSEHYIPFVEQHKSSRYFNHNLYHVLALYSVRSLQNISHLVDKSNPMITQTVDSIYAVLHDMYSKQNRVDALILLGLEICKQKKQNEQITTEAYISQLDTWIKDHSDREICAEVYLVKAQEWVNQRKMNDALQLCRKAIANYPAYERINALKELEDHILSPSLSVEMPDMAYPGDTLTLEITHTNLNGFTIRLYKVNLPDTSSLWNSAPLEGRIEKYATKSASEHFSLTRPADYLPTKVSYPFIMPQVGKYWVEFIPDEVEANPGYQSLSVTRLCLLSKKTSDAGLEVVTLDSKSGHPVTDATVKLFRDLKGHVELSQAQISNSNGRIEMTKNEDDQWIKVEKDDDNAYIRQWISGNSLGFTNRGAGKQIVTLLTDRSLYRPGQTVYVKGVAYRQVFDSTQVIEGGTFTVSLRDPNLREIQKKSLQTNEFGSFTAEFILPQNSLNGAYSLCTDETRTGIHVEEYKRPTFEVILNKPEGSYQLGDKIEIKGLAKSYSGVSMQDVSVRYEVKRRHFSWWRHYQNRTFTYSGMAELNDIGEFVLPITLKPDQQFDSDLGYYSFTVSTTVTHINGETQTTILDIRVGNRSLVLSTGVLSPLNKDAGINFVFKAQNLDGLPIHTEGEYKLYPSADEISGTWVGEPICTGRFISNTDTRLPEWEALSSGAYKLKFTAHDEQGREAAFETEITLFSINDKRPAIKKGLCYYPINTTFDTMQPAEFMFGTSDKEAYILMDVTSGGKLLESRSFVLSDSILHFIYPYKETYGDGLRISFRYVKKGECHAKSVILMKKKPEKELKLSWNAFRNKLRPGQREEWTLTVRNPNNAFADAELLATMYDASLDKIWKRSQSLEVDYNRSIPFTFWAWYSIKESSSYYFSFPKKTWSYPLLTFDTFWSERIDSQQFPVTIFKFRSHSLGRQAMLTRERVSKHYYLEKDPEEQTILETIVDSSILKENLSQSMPVRSDFSETAFFYPQLRTNQKGEVVIAFTMPESLTRWNFSGYAHTKDMLTGLIESTIVTDKPFMLMPNLPRFVRIGDKSAVPALIVNLTEKAISGDVVFTLFDPLTDKVIATQKQQFSVEAGKTIAVNFLFTATNAYKFLGCRFVAEGDEFSDGEQHLLPVLSNRERALETVPMPIRGEQTREFSLDHLFNNNSPTVTDRKLTVEFSGSPAWYAIQALPSLCLPAHDDAISLVTAYYANTLAAFIMNRQPRLKALFDTWRKQEETRETFLSNLQKNQDVKQILLEESPWILEAITEQEQRERIATLFDLNNILSNSAATLHKLKNLQFRSGAWAWYKGMKESRYVTNYVAQLLARFTLLTRQPFNGEIAGMYNRALDFLHKEALTEYEELLRKKNGASNGEISGNALQYLYLVAISRKAVPEANKAAHHYFLEQAKGSITSLTIQQKALAAVALKKAGYTTEAQAFLASLKEYATQTDEHGVFYAFDENPSSWTGLKVPAHVSVMEAFDIVGQDKLVIEEMKWWLLKEKQTQQWNSPVATANAVHALLYCGVGSIGMKGDVQITLGKRVIGTQTSSSAMPGIAYIKETLTDEQLLSDIKKAVVEKRDKGIAWGAVYADYEEDIDKLKTQSEGLSVDKKLYIERIEDSKKELLPIATDTPLKVGDKVVSRITIKLDRSMDFVQLKDQHASCLEPVNSLSGYRWGSGTSYYVAVKDASTQFYFDALRKGVYVLEHSYRVNRTGIYETGTAVIQSTYAPEFAARSASIRVTVEK